MSTSTDARPVGGAAGYVPRRRLAGDRIWDALAKASFAVISHVTPAGEPRSSGVVYTVVEHRMYVVVAKDGWKARHIAANGDVAVTVPVRRGGVMSLWLPIPPATISFPATATVHSCDDARLGPAMDRLAPLLPPRRQASSRILEVRPRGHFLTYGVGVPLMRMRDPALARARVPVKVPSVGPLRPCRPTAAPGTLGP
jgi:hypothetical protein